jgi:hypothetical protein
MRQALNRESVLDALRGAQKELSARGIEHLFLFGSVARGDQRPNSDVDLFLDVRPGAKFSLFDLVGVKYLAEDLLGHETDVTTRDGLHPMLKSQIEQSAIRVF